MTDAAALSERSRRAVRLAAISCLLLVPLGIPWLLWVMLGTVQLDVDRTVLLVFFVPGVGGVVLALWRLQVGWMLWQLASGESRAATHGSTIAVATLGAISLCTGGAATACGVWMVVAGDWAHHSMIWAGPMIVISLFTGWLACAHGVLLLRARRHLIRLLTPMTTEISTASAPQS